MGARKRRVLLVTNRYRTYHRGVIEACAGAFDFELVWLSPPYPSDPPPADISTLCRTWVLSDDPGRLTYRHVRRSFELFRFLVERARGADLVIAPSPAAWKARVCFAACEAVGVPIAFRTDVWRTGDGLVRAQRPADRGLLAGPRRRAAKSLDRVVRARAAGYLVPGAAAARFLKADGIDPSKVARFPRLHPDLTKLPVSESVRASLEAFKRGRLMFLYLGRVMHQKGLVPLVRAFRQVLATGRDAVLVVAGGPITEDTGAGRPSREYFEEAQQAAAGEPRIRFVGPVAPTDVQPYYAAADVFVHPHVAVVDGQEVFEPWGNVISEAACMSLAIIASDRVAAAYDLVHDGRNGFRLDARRLEEALPRALATCIDDRARVAQLRRASRAVYEEFADPRAIVEAAEQLTRSRA